MNRQIIKTGVGLSAALIIFLSALPSFAEEDVTELKKQIETLQKRVDDLEAERKQPVQTPNPRDLFFQRRQWDPFAEINRMQQQMDQVFQNSFNNFDNDRGVFSSNMSFSQEIDIKEKDEKYVIHFDMTGMDENQVDIQINEHSITVKGEHSVQNIEEGDNGKRSSHSYGSFMQTIPLPVDADTSDVKTEKEGDSLVIYIPKKKS